MPSVRSGSIFIIFRAACATPGRRLVGFLAAATVRVVQGVVKSLQFSCYISGRNLARQLVNDMPYFVGVNAGVFSRILNRVQLSRKRYVRRKPGTQVDGDTAQVVSGERNARSRHADAFLCDGVKLRCRDGLIRSTSHSSAHNSSADFERAAFDVAGEAAACVNLSTMRVIPRKSPSRAVRRIIA